MIREGNERLQSFVSDMLVHEDGTLRHLPDSEEQRVEELLDDEYIDPYAGEARAAKFGRNLLERAGLHQPKPPELVERPHLKESQTRRTKDIIADLDYSRELIRRNVVDTAEDALVDARLGIRSEDCILPPIIKEQHRLFEEELGQETSFLTWMAEHASNEQLMNVWQWHDKYISDLDNDPAFQERVASIKTGYMEGVQKAIAAGMLHPNASVDSAKMQNIRIAHGSPLSPALTWARATANTKLGAVQMREGVTDTTLYHELTHMLSDGLVHELNEGATDMIAAEVYNRQHPTEEPYDLEGSAYANQIATLGALNRLSDGHLNLYELSRAYTSSDELSNTIAIQDQITESVGLPILIPMIQASREAVAKASDMSVGNKRNVLDLILRKRAEFLADITADADGNRSPSIAKELISRALTDDNIDTYGQGAILNGIESIMAADELRRKFAVGTSGNK